jgi:nucleoredoxin
VCAGSEQAAVGVKQRVGGIPSLVVVRPDGELLDLHGADRVEKDAAGALAHWQALLRE